MAETTHPADEAHETQDVDRRVLLRFGAVFAGLLVLALVVLWLVFGIRGGGFAASQTIVAVPTDGELAERQQLRDYLAAEQTELNRLAWADASHEYAKLPIDDAMKLLAAKGANR